jgi:hypothetical protein
MFGLELDIQKRDILGKPEYDRGEAEDDRKA